MTKRTALPMLIAFTALGCSAGAGEDGEAPPPFSGAPTMGTAPLQPQGPGNPASPGGAVAPTQTNEGAGNPGLVAPGANGGAAFEPFT